MFTKRQTNTLMLSPRMTRSQLEISMFIFMFLVVLSIYCMKTIYRGYIPKTCIGLIPFNYLKETEDTMMKELANCSN